jgi:outer membrane lipoprotein carrier protein
MSAIKQRRAMILGAMLVGLPLVGAVHAASTQAPSAVVSKTPAATEAEATTALNRALAKLNSLQADFSQTTQTTSSKAAPKNAQSLRSSHLNQSFSGVMQVKRAGNFRWETTSPMKQLIVTNGKTVWIYDPDLEQATRQQLNEQISNTPALLLSGQTDAIKKSFQVTQPSKAQPYFVLYPRDKEGVFESLAIRFNGDVPSQMILKDSLGQQTTVTFSNAKLNVNLSNDLFAFVPPKGTDVIDQ